MKRFISPTAWGFFLLAAPLNGGAQTRPLVVEFSAQEQSFSVATDEYRAIWAAEGERIVIAMERATGLQFERGPIQAIVFEGVSESGYRAIPMRLRASYPHATKQATLVHELGHRLISEFDPSDFDSHPTLFLFLYDVWVALWGREFADAQVAVEGQRRGLYDYEGAWKTALALSAPDRAARFKEFKLRQRKP